MPRTSPPKRTTELTARTPPARRPAATGDGASGGIGGEGGALTLPDASTDISRATNAPSTRERPYALRATNQRKQTQQQREETGETSQVAPEQGPIEHDDMTTPSIITPMAWLYQKNDDELLQIADFLKMEARGTLEDTRRTILLFLKDNPEFINAARDLNNTSANKMTAIKNRTPTLDTAAILTQVRKWGCSFDGKDPVSFLERLTELKEGFSLASEDLMKGFPEILKGNALLWFRNQKNTWKDWADFENDFRRRYLPRQYLRTIKRDAENRLQRPGERYTDYETDLLTLLRRAGIIDEGEQLEQLFDNLHPDYKIFIKRRDLRNRAELCDLALQYECILEQRNALRVRQENRGPAIRRIASTIAAYDRNRCCWRCKQEGHNRYQCQQQARLFCSFCGKDGVLTRDCHPFSGNAPRVEGTPANPRPAERPA